MNISDAVRLLCVVCGDRMIFDNNRTLTIRIHTLTLLLLLLLLLVLLWCTCFTLPSTRLSVRQHSSIWMFGRQQNLCVSNTPIVLLSVRPLPVSHVCRVRAVVIDFSTGAGLTFSIRSPVSLSYPRPTQKPLRNFLLARHKSGLSGGEIAFSPIDKRKSPNTRL